jgi:anti-sigma regulatory factor (Ser/Thr protein kinase)
MTMTTALATTPQYSKFRHEALLYAGADGFLAGTLPFIRAGLEAEEPTLVVVDRGKIDTLRDALNGDARSVQFADMAEVGFNPARIIPAWREFVDAHGGAGRRVRGIGEPIDVELSAAALVECQHHESLLNLAFADSGPFELLCPYDTDSLPPAVIAEAAGSHPYLLNGAGATSSGAYRGLSAFAAPFDAPLAPAPINAARLDFDAHSLHALRAFVGDQAVACGLPPEPTDDLTLSVNEIATNSVRHGAGAGELRVWLEHESLICEVSDRGAMDAPPLAGRVVPAPSQLDGRGLWLANQLCELMQVRSFTERTVVRLHMRIRAAS